MNPGHRAESFIPPAPMEAGIAAALEGISIESLPNRRHHYAITGEWCDGKTRLGFQLGIGFDDQGRVVELFADGMKQGATMEALLDDACILVSFLLQSGWDIAAIAAKLKRESEEAISPAPSIIGHTCQLATAFQADIQAKIGGAGDRL